MTKVVPTSEVSYSDSGEPRLSNRRRSRLQKQLEHQGLIEPLMVRGETDWRLIGEPWHDELLCMARHLEWETVIIAWYNVGEYDD